MLELGLVSAVLSILLLHGSWTIVIAGKNNLDNHSSGDRSSSLPWNVLIDNPKPNQTHTNSYSNGQTYYYSPATYGQSTQSSEPQPSYSYPTSTTTTSAPDYSPQVKTPVTYYNFDGSPLNVAASSNVRNKITFPGSAYFKPGSHSNSQNVYSNPPQSYTNSQQSYHNSQPSYSSPTRSSQGQYYYTTHKDRHQQPQDDQEDPYEDRYKPNSSSDDYEEDDEPSYPSRVSPAHYHTKRRPGHKNHIHKYQDNDDMDTDKADYERPEESEKTPTYSEGPWNRYGSKYGGPYGGPPGYPGSYGYDYDKMAFAGKDPYGTPWAFLLGLLPLGLLMAAMVPNVVSVPLAAAAAAGVGRRRRDVERPALQYPVLEAISRFGVANLDDPKCLQRIFCNVTRAGRSNRANIVQKAFYRLVTIIDENWVERIGLKQLFRAVRTNQCDAFTCTKNDRQTSQQQPTKDTSQDKPGGNSKHKTQQQDKAPSS